MVIRELPHTLSRYNIPSERHPDIFPPQRLARLAWYATEDDAMLGVVVFDHQSTRWGYATIRQVKAGTPGGDAVIGISPGMANGYFGLNEDEVVWCRTIEDATAELLAEMSR
jgi:hypothetical protein